MKKSLFSLIISASTFLLGLCAAHESYPLVTLEDISENSDYYDGKTVEIISYAHLFEIEDKFLVIGEPYEKKEAFTVLDLKENFINSAPLQNQLSKDFTINKYQRVKVRVIGKVQDNCNHGITCCFGKSLTIYAKNIRQIGQIEDYTVPLKFQINNSTSNSE